MPLKEIEEELDKLVQDGILQPVELTEWAAPVVPVVKPDQSIRMCGDFRLTVNQAGGEGGGGGGEVYQVRFE